MGWRVVLASVCWSVVRRCGCDKGRCTSEVMSGRERWSGQGFTWGNISRGGVSAGGCVRCWVVSGSRYGCEGKRVAVSDGRWVWSMCSKLVTIVLGGGVEWKCVYSAAGVGGRA